MNEEIYEKPGIVYEGKLEVQAGSTPPKDEILCDGLD